MPSSSADDAPMQALVLELVEGLTLADRLLSGPVGVSEALAIARHVSSQMVRQALVSSAQSPKAALGTRATAWPTWLIQLESPLGGRR